MVDIEADGPIPGDHSMICFGAVLLNPGLDRIFYGRLKPISDIWDAPSLAITGFSREETLRFEEPRTVMERFADWIAKEVRSEPMFISDNAGFDWLFMSWYFHHFLGSNPFGFRSTDLGSLYKGLVKDTRQNFKHLRRTKHSHHPVDDAMGNAEALLHMRDEMGLKIEL
jgi:hypothetical protein